MARKPPPTARTERQPIGNKDRPNQADRLGTERRGGARRSGEGSESALASLRTMERDLAKSKPTDDDASNR